MGTKKGHTSFLANYDDLPHELQTGLLPGDKRESMGESSCSSISIDPLTFNLIIVAVIALGGYCISKTVSHFMPGFELPVFSCAFVVGIFIKKIFDKTRTSDYVCPQTIGHISGAFTDFLVAFGIASIKISVVIEYIIPLLILLVSGLIATLIYVLVMARKLMKECWFEKAIFTWGWFTGTMAMGIALLRVADPKMRSRCWITMHWLTCSSPGRDFSDNFRSGSFLERLRTGVYGNLPGGRTCRTGNRLYQRLVYQETINGMTPE